MQPNQSVAGPKREGHFGGEGREENGKAAFVCAGGAPFLGVNIRDTAVALPNLARLLSPAGYPCHIQAKAGSMECG